MKRDPRCGEKLIAPDGRVGMVSSIDRRTRKLRLTFGDFSNIDGDRSDWIAFADVKVPRISNERLEQLAEKAFAAAVEDADLPFGLDVEIENKS